MHPVRSRHSALALSLLLAGACATGTPREPATLARMRSSATVEAAAPRETRRVWLLERVGDVAVVQLYADGFERLTLRDKKLAWHLYQAALAGRDIYYRQRCAEGVVLRDLCEEILTHPRGVDPRTLDQVRRYAKLLWIHSSPYDSATGRKFLMPATHEDLVLAAQAAARDGAALPKRENETVRNLIARLAPILFDPEHEPTLTAKNPEEGRDALEASAVEFYGPDVRARDLEQLEERFALNSTIVKTPTGRVEEAVWRAGDPWKGIPEGFYAEELRAVAGHLREAARIAPGPMRTALDALTRFYRTGERADRVAHDIAWVAAGAEIPQAGMWGDDVTAVDTINGFVEVYLDPRGVKGAWEGVVLYEHPQRARAIQTVARHAQWFEDHMPFEERFRRPAVGSVSARSVDVLIATGDAGPVSELGILLPNDPSIREEYGSRSFNLANVNEAQGQSTPKPLRVEFAWDQAEIEREERWGSITAELMAALHEVVGHASGRQAIEGQGDPAPWLREHGSALEEARADLVALYFMMDEELARLGLLADVEQAALATYERYTRHGGLLQLRRVRNEIQLEQDHMRGRQLVVRWIQDNSNAVEGRVRDGKHYLVVTDARAWREAAGRLLAIVQRIKSTGDYDAARDLFERYGIRFSAALRDEVVARCQALGLPSTTAFVMPRLTPVYDRQGGISDVAISYPLSLELQMLEWSGRRAVPAQ